MTARVVSAVVVLAAAVLAAWPVSARVLPDRDGPAVSRWAAGLVITVTTVTVGFAAGTAAWAVAG